MGLGDWYDTQTERLKQTVGDIGEDLRESYNFVASTAESRREAFMQELEDISPRLAGMIQGTDRAFALIERGAQNGVVEISAGLTGIGGDVILNNTYKLFTGEKLYNGSAENWTREHLNGAIDGIQEVTSLGANKPLTDLSDTEQNISDIFSAATQLALPAVSVAGGVVKGRRLLEATRNAHMSTPQRGWLRNFFDDAAHFSQHPVRSTKEALSFTNSTKNSLQQGHQLSAETVQLTSRLTGLGH